MELYPKYKEKERYEEIKESVTTPTDDPDVNIIDWEALLAINPDTVGWITVPGTHIDYPVVQTTDNDYYLLHSFENEYYGYGTPFLDYTYDFNRNPIAQNSVVYAHNSRWGDQVGFEGLQKFEDYDYFLEHPIVYYTTIADGNIPIPYEIVAVIKESYTFDYRRPDFSDQIDFIQYYNTIMNHRLYDTGKKIYQNDQLVTLSSCVFDMDNGRVGLIARRINPKPIYVHPEETIETIEPEIVDTPEIPVEDVTDVLIEDFNREEI